MSVPRPTGSGPPDARQRPVARFLGDAEATGGPFALLGVSPQACTDELVLSGLDRQIERLNRHPECDTPEADEVRLALHAAAAQMLDPVVKRHLIARWGGVAVATKPVAAPVSRATMASPTRVLDTQRLLEADAILTLGLFGGWNQRALRRLVSLAHRRGMSSAQVAQTLRNLSRKRGRTRPSRPASGPQRRPTSRLQASPRAAPQFERVEPKDDPGQRLLRNAMIFGFLGLVALTAAVTGIIVATRQRPLAPTPPAPAPIANNAPTGAGLPIYDQPKTAEPVAVRKPTPPIDPADLAAIPRDIAACTEGLAIDPASAVLRFETAVGKLGAHWTAIPKDRLLSSHDAIVEFLYRCSATPDIAVRAVGAIARYSGALGAGEAMETDVAPATWSMGMLTRLGREKDLTASAKNAIDSAVAVVLGQAPTSFEQSFEAGAAAAINAWPQKLVVAKTDGGGISVEAWRSWAQGAEALAGADSPSKVRFLLTGLETLLVQGPEPNSDRSAAAVIADLTTRMTWRKEDESRRWLMRWFGDTRISAADLNAVTSTLATRSGAEGIDLTMVLSTSASENTRAELRERFATVWGVQDSLARDALAMEWAKLAREAINASFTSGSEADELAAAVVLVRLNDAAWWQWRGDGGEAANLLADIRGPVERAMSIPERIKEDEPAKPDLSDAAWAERYLAAKNSPKIKRDMLEQMQAAEVIGPTDAEVIAGEAFTGSPPEVRSAAIDIVKKRADSASMLAAVLERLPRAPKTAAVADLVSQVAARPLPGFRDPDWPIAARRAIVERLLEAMAAESPRVRIDRLSILLAASYRSMASPSPIPPDQRVAHIQPTAFLSAAEVWRKWRGAADALVPSTPPPIAIDQVERRRIGRLHQARGMVQVFAAEQTSIAEAMSYVVSAEQPAKVEQVRLVLTNMASDRRHAGNILEQIKITERAVAQLWLIRMQQEPAS